MAIDNKTGAKTYIRMARFDVGEDTGTPVVEEYAAKMPFRFTGRIERFTIELK